MARRLVCSSAQITINVSENAVVPACPMPGHAWKHVQHDPKVTWLATWTENVMGQHKYVFLAASSGFKGESDLKKYEKVRVAHPGAHRNHGARN